MKKILVVVLFSLIFVNFTNAQELDATVVVNVDQLQNDAKERLNGFDQVIQDYLNNNKYTSQPWDGERIKCTFNIFFLGSSDETTYTAQLVVSSQRPIENTPLSSLMLSVMDNFWGFKYERGQSMTMNQSDFDPLASFLDFYANVIIGFDFDSFYSLGGTDYFQRALDIVVKGANSKFAKGWTLESTVYNKRALIDNLLNAKYQQFRQDFFEYHYNGIDLLNSPKDRESAIANMIRLVTNLEKRKDQIDWRSVLMKVFFDAKAGEFVQYLKDLPDKSVFTTLKKIDPAHTAKYEEALN